MENLLRLRSMKLIHGILKKQHTFISYSIRRNHEQVQQRTQYTASDILKAEYYTKSFRYLDNNDDDTWLVVDKLDFNQSLNVRNMKEKYQKEKEWRKLKTQICHKNFYINQLFEHYEYYESKSEYLKDQLYRIENEIDLQIENDQNTLNIDQQIDQILDTMELEKIEEQMLTVDISLKLKKIHEVIHPLITNDVCYRKDFADAVIDGSYNGVIAKAITNDKREKLKKWNN